MDEDNLCKRLLEGDNLRVICDSGERSGTWSEERGTYDKEAKFDMNEIRLIQTSTPVVPGHPASR